MATSAATLARQNTSPSIPSRESGDATSWPARGQAAGVLARCQGRCCQEGLGRELGVQGGVVARTDAPSVAVASQAVLARKLDALAAADPDVIATGNPGCIMQIARGAAERGLRARVVHPVELLAEAYA